MVEEVTHARLLSELQQTRQQDEKAHERIDSSLSNVNAILHGRNGTDGGVIRDMVQIKVTLKIGVWLVAVVGASSIAALVGIFFRLAEMR